MDNRTLKMAVICLGAFTGLTVVIVAGMITYILMSSTEKRATTAPEQNPAGQAPAATPQGQQSGGSLPNAPSNPMPKGKASANDLIQFEATAIRAYSGDGVTVNKVGTDAWSGVRLIGVDAGKPGERDQEPWATRAQQFLNLAIARKKIVVEVVDRPPDNWGNRYGYVWLGETLMNEHMLRQGLAQLRFAPGAAYMERLEAAANEAKSSRRGMYATN